jgi:hypothetical protein
MEKDTTYNQMLNENRSKDLYTVIINYRDGRPDKVYKIGLTEAQVKRLILDKMTPAERDQCNVFGFGQLRLTDKQNNNGLKIFNEAKGKNAKK